MIAAGPRGAASPGNPEPAVTAPPACPARADPRHAGRCTGDRCPPCPDLRHPVPAGPDRPLRAVRPVPADTARPTPSMAWKANRRGAGSPGACPRRPAGWRRQSRPSDAGTWTTASAAGAARRSARPGRLRRDPRPRPAPASGRYAAPGPPAAPGARNGWPRVPRTAGCRLLSMAVAGRGPCSRAAVRPVPRRRRDRCRCPHAFGGPSTARRYRAVFTGCVARAYEAGLHVAISPAAGRDRPTRGLPDGQGCCGMPARPCRRCRHAAAALAAATNHGPSAGASRTVLTLASGCHEAVAAAVPVDAATPSDHVADRTADRLRFAHRARNASPCTCPAASATPSAATPRCAGCWRACLALEVVVLDAGFGCCGAAGTAYADQEPARADRFRQLLPDQFARQRR